MDPSAALETTKKKQRIPMEDEREKSTENSLAVPKLDFDVFADIFSRLKVKPLIQYRTVSKLFLSLIHNPFFIKLHLSKTFTQSTEDRIFIHVNSEQLVQTHLYLSNFDTVAKTLVTYKRVKLPLKGKYGSLRIVGSSNGLICFSDTMSYWHHGSSGSSLFVWNPILGKFKVLPDPHPKCVFDAKLMVGFAFIPEITDYKILQIVFDSYSDTDTVVFVYTLGESCWRKINVAVPCYLPNSFGGDVFVNGSIHWCGSKRLNSDATGEDRIILFDMSNEVFAEFGLPNNIGPDFKVRNISASCSGDSLSLFAYDNDGWAVWSMREYGVVESWVKQCYIVDLLIYFPLKPMNNGDIFASKRTGYLSFFDPENQDWKDTEIRCPLDVGLTFGCPTFGYTQSLGLLNETDH